MNRRDILKGGVAVGAVAVVPALAGPKTHDFMAGPTGNPDEFHVMLRARYGLGGRLEQIVCNGDCNFRVVLTDIEEPLALPVSHPLLRTVQSLHRDWVIRGER